MPGTTPFLSLFRRSPFKPMQEHIRVVQRCVAEVPGLIEAAVAGDRDAVEAAKDKIFALEKAADDIKDQLRSHLPASLLMPVDRRDLLEILHLQDAIADTAQDIAGLLVIRPMDVPPALAAPLRAYTARCVDACDVAARIVEEFDELVETGFSGRESEAVSEMVAEVARIETETDDMGMALARELFAHEGNMSAVSVMFWHRLIERIGGLADYAEKVGDRLRLLLAR